MQRPDRRLPAVAPGALAPLAQARRARLRSRATNAADDPPLSRQRAAVPASGRGAAAEDSRRAGAAARRAGDGRQRPVGQAARPAADRGPQGRGVRALRRDHGRDRAGHPVPVGLRVLDRELAPVAGRGPVPDGLQPGRDPPPPRPAELDGRADPVGRPPAAAVAVGHLRAGGRRADDRRQLGADAAVLRELRRPGRDRGRGAGRSRWTWRRAGSGRTRSTSA